LDLNKGSGNFQQIWPSYVMNDRIKKYLSGWINPETFKLEKPNVSYSFCVFLLFFFIFYIFYFFLFFFLQCDIIANDENYGLKGIGVLFDVPKITYFQPIIELLQTNGYIPGKDLWVRLLLLFST
jgi:hypothetical protein